jgi:hypothetical protein
VWRRQAHFSKTNPISRLLPLMAFQRFQTANGALAEAVGEMFWPSDVAASSKLGEDYPGGGTFLREDHLSG